MSLLSEFSSDAVAYWGQSPWGSGIPTGLDYNIIPVIWYHGWLGIWSPDWIGL